MSLAEIDKKIIWHPFTQEKTAPAPIEISKAKGAYLYDHNGKSYLDLVSSWWVNLHGHAHPEIAKAIYEQALELEHVIFAGFTHKPAVTICDKINNILPNDLTRFFFADNGSTSVETALKMAYQFWWNKNEKHKKMFLCFDGGYHGDTFGAMSVGAGSGFHDAFSNHFFPVLRLPYPATWEGDVDIDAREAAIFSQLDKYLAEYQDQIAAMILEPLVQGAAGMQMCRPQFIAKLVDVLRGHDILVIFDEVMTGFGRTGTTFALDQIKRTPDFLCLSKGLTGGFLPLSLTVTTERIYQAFLGEHFTKAFAHGHSYTANPLGCAAAIASFDLLYESETIAAIKAIHSSHRAGLDMLVAQSSNIEHVRLRGTIAAFDVARSANCDFKLLKARLLDQGYLLRPLGNTIYLMPPYCVTEDELGAVYAELNKLIS